MTGRVLLKGTKITKLFEKLAAVNNVDFELEEGEILGLIGPNGSGKTTLLNVIGGVLRADSGRLHFRGKDIIGLGPNEICRMGIAKTNQIVRPFWNASALDNAVVGALFGKDRHIRLSEARKEALGWLDFVGISAKAHTIAKFLTYNDLRMLEVARALATKPTILLLDEMAAGLNPVETDGVVKTIMKIRDELNITIIWVEHKMKEIMNTASRIIVFNCGEKIAEGPPKEIVNDHKVIEVYLGVD
jgi:branched-chain amino acid transport system ATP-binding protein